MSSCCLLFNKTMSTLNDVSYISAFAQSDAVPPTHHSALEEIIPFVPASPESSPVAPSPSQDVVLVPNVPLLPFLDFKRQRISLANVRMLVLLHGHRIDARMDRQCLGGSNTVEK